MEDEGISDLSLPLGQIHYTEKAVAISRTAHHCSRGRRGRLRRRSAIEEGRSIPERHEREHTDAAQFSYVGAMWSNATRKARCTYFQTM